MPSENGTRQIVKALLAILAPVSLALGLGVVSPLLGDYLGRALGAGYPLRPTHFTDRSVALGVVNQILDIQHELRIHVEESEKAMVGNIAYFSTALYNSLKHLLSHVFNNQWRLTGACRLGLSTIVEGDFK